VSGVIGSGVSDEHLPYASARAASTDISRSHMVMVSANASLAVKTYNAVAVRAEFLKDIQNSSSC